MKHILLISKVATHLLASFLLVVVHHCEHGYGILVILVVFEFLHETQELLFLLSLWKHFGELCLF